MVEGDDTTEGDLAGEEDFAGEEDGGEGEGAVEDLAGDEAFELVTGVLAPTTVLGFNAFVTTQIKIFTIKYKK
jgi:hypothetical protein